MRRFFSNEEQKEPMLFEEPLIASVSCLAM